MTTQNQKSPTFIINPQADYIESHDALSLLLLQTNASVTALVNSHNEDYTGFTLNYAVIISLLTGVSSQLETAHATLEHLYKQQKGGNHA